ncbi:ABC transporter permease, partial [Rhizobiaceae sp. 2RAB30]
MKSAVRTALLAAALAAGTAFAVPAMAEDAVGLPNLSYRTGPFAATGIPLMNGQRDYMMMLIERDGGVDGVKLGYDECETGYN